MGFDAGALITALGVAILIGSLGVTTTFYNKLVRAISRRHLKASCQKEWSRPSFPTKRPLKRTWHNWAPKKRWRPDASGWSGWWCSQSQCQHHEYIQRRRILESLRLCRWLVWQQAAWRHPRLPVDYVVAWWHRTSHRITGQRTDRTLCSALLHFHRTGHHRSFDVPVGSPGYQSIEGHYNPEEENSSETEELNPQWRNE